jgi:transposase
MSIYSPRGKVTLMFLKGYVCCSDRKLMEGLNGNLNWQFFLGINAASALEMGRRMAASRAERAA